MLNHRSFDDVSSDVPLPSDWLDTQHVDMYKRAPVLKGSAPVWGKTESHASAFLGLFGIGLLLFVLAVIFPFLLRFLSGSLLGNRPKFWVLVPILMFMTLPAVSVACIAVSVPMFWYVSILKRYLAALLLLAPATCGLIAGFMVTEKIDFAEIGPPTIVLISAGFVAAATIGVVFQLCTPWTLTHFRVSEEELPRIGIGTLVSLTTVIAISIAFIRLFDSSDMTNPILVFAAISGLGGLVGTSCCIAFLREGRPNRKWIAVAFATVFSMSLFFVGLIASLEFGWHSVIYQFTISVPISLLGAAIVSFFAAICIYWLRVCGWRCVR